MLRTNHPGTSTPTASMIIPGRRPRSSNVAAGSHRRRAAFVSLLILLASIRRAWCEDQNPTTAACSSELAAWAKCLKDNNLDGQWCADCYIDYYDFAFTSPPTCGYLTSQICNWIDACDFNCASSICGPYIEAYETCHWGSDCFFGCPYSNPLPSYPSGGPAVPMPTLAVGTFPPAVAPALAAASSSECDDAVSSFSACAGTASGQGASSCLTGINEYVPAALGVGTCTDVELYACTAMEACPVCGNCQAELITLINCSKQGECDTLTCPTTSAAPAAAAPSFAPSTVLRPVAGPSPPVIAPAVASPPSPVASPTSGSSRGGGCRHRLAATILAVVVAGILVAAPRPV